MAQAAVMPTTATMPMNKRRRNWTPYVLLVPSLVYLAVFFAVPMVQAFGLAFQDADNNWSFDSWRRVFNDPNFTSALRTTLILIVVIIPIQFALALAMALVINAKLKFSGLWLYIYAVPLGISELAAGIVWYSIFTQNGWLNSFLEQLGFLDRPFIFLSFDRQGWLILTVVIAEAWRATSLIMVILVAGLQGIPKDYLEAADVYGATFWQKVTRVILPIMRPSIQVALILRTILAFQAFAVVIALAGAREALTVLSAEAYYWYQDIRDPHVAAAYAALILFLSILSTILFLWLVPVRQEQQG
ncbi:MAG: sugar ABC transporter permease [Chloroflexota bacterium]|nr:sugar ABC transporter permease [Chloroflexota bacterium]